MAGFAREVVIKCIHEHLGNNSEFVEMFLDEARLVARLSHPNIVLVHEFGREGTTYYLVMEYVDGKSLSEAIHKSQGMEPAQALRIVSEVCAGLHYAHSLKDDAGHSLRVVHRDVSPPNVLLGFDGSVKLIDFGVAKATTQVHETRAGSFKGKYAYMAPEQAYGQPADQLSDLHSVGILFWEMLMGRPLFQADNVFQTMDAVLNMTPPSVLERCPQLTPRVDEILAKALAKDPMARYQSCSDLQADVDELAAESGLHSSSLGLARYIQDLFGRTSPSSVPPAAPPLEVPGNEAGASGPQDWAGFLGDPGEDDDVTLQGASAGGEWVEGSEMVPADSVDIPSLFGEEDEEMDETQQYGDAAARILSHPALRASEPAGPPSPQPGALAGDVISEAVAAPDDLSVRGSAEGGDRPTLPELNGFPSRESAVSNGKNSETARPASALAASEEETAGVVEAFWQAKTPRAGAGWKRPQVIFALSLLVGALVGGLAVLILSVWNHGAGP